MTATTVGVLREPAAGERRVATTPETVGRLRTTGAEVVVETGAGERAWYPDSAYTAAGATVLPREEVYAGSGLLLCVHGPADPALLRPGQVLVGLLQLETRPEEAQRLARAGVTALALEGLPRTLSRAQAMDALTSQASVAGYKAALVAADTYGGFFPLLMTAAGTTRPARVLVLGAGVAGLQALATARRLGAVVTGYDVRDAARAEVLSLGASFLDLPAAVSATGEGGYARALTADEQAVQQRALSSAIAGFDVVITTAQVPGRRPPVLVPADALAALRPGSVVVDLAAGELGGNVEGSPPSGSLVTDHGVTVVAAGDLASAVPQAASTAYARNLCALVAHLVPDGSLQLDPSDELQAALLVTHDGQVVHPRLLPDRTEAVA